jgi:copper transport protein
VRIVFSEAPDPRGSEIAVFDASGARVDTGAVSGADEPNSLRVALREIGVGGYIVAWTALSTVDGHHTRGSFVFAVGDAPLPAIADVPEGAAPPRSLELAGRALSFGGMALLVGGALFGILVRRTHTPSDLAREQVLLAVGGAMLVLAAVALLLDQGGRAPQRLTALLSVRGLAGVAVLGAAAALAAVHLRRVALLAGVIATLTATLVSHAAAYGAPHEMAIDLVHALGAFAWTGALAAMVVTLVPGGVRAPRGELGRLVGRFSTLALVAVGAMSLTGLLQALLRLVVIQDLWETPYGLAVLAKSALLALALALASLNLLRWGPRLRAMVDAARSERALRLGVRGEVALVAAILVVTAVLTALVPPAQPSGAAFDETRHAEGLRLRLMLASTSPGQNRYVLRVQDGALPVTDALRVALRFTMVEHDMGENELIAEQRGPGEYVARGNVTAMFGTWRIQAIVRRPGRADVATTFTTPIGAPTGPGAVARVVQAPPYTMVVYVDPPQPVAGAPIILNVVLVDAKGDPVAQKALRVTFSGPGSEAVDATEVSVGRYDAAVPGLAAGRWTARIAVGREAEGEYAFDVAR